MNSFGKAILFSLHPKKSEQKIGTKIKWYCDNNTKNELNISEKFLLLLSKFFFLWWQREWHQNGKYHKQKKKNYSLYALLSSR